MNLSGTPPGRAARRWTAMASKMTGPPWTPARTLPYHNGRTEGINTRTKRIMRQMHGAGFDLPHHRILLP